MRIGEQVERRHGGHRGSGAQHQGREVPPARQQTARGSDQQQTADPKPGEAGKSKRRQVAVGDANAGIAVGFHADERREHHQHAQPADGDQQKENDAACAHESFDHVGLRAGLGKTVSFAAGTICDEISRRSRTYVDCFGRTIFSRAAW